jgi:endonuclease/exonuclease/phosphatase family metal-dependent hydrolase
MVRDVHLSLVVACAIAALTPLGARSSSRQPGEPQAKPRALRVMTYNIKHGQTNTVCTQAAAIPDQPPSRDCNLDLQASAAVIRAHEPDIVGVQEVDRFWARSASEDEPAALSAALGLPHYCYGANLDHQPDSHATVPHQYGTVILSRFPILECTNTLLPRTGTNEQRGLTLALIDVRGVRLRFYNTHLHTTAADRLLQTAEIARLLDAAGDVPRLLTGDFNARPTAPELAPIRSRLVDSWVKAGRRPTDNPDGLTSPARLTGGPASRIDYVWVSPAIAVESVQVPLDAQTRVASDHYPVVANITTGTIDGDKVVISARHTNGGEYRLELTLQSEELNGTVTRGDQRAEVRTKRRKE